MIMEMINQVINSKTFMDMDDNKHNFFYFINETVVFSLIVQPSSNLYLALSVIDFNFLYRH
eukprot:m.5533 g.5533  ORF g.5533 m.5533 type:complete len:61 (-) comp2422_c0_seq1:431-613(-)